MDAKSFSDWVIAQLALPSKARHRQMADRHTLFQQDYVRTLLSIDAEHASQVGGLEGRTFQQAVGLQAAWDRFRLAGASDLLLGIFPPRSLTDTRGYVDLEGRKLEFISVDEFNRYQLEQQADWTWERTREFAIQSTGALQAFFAHPHLLSVHVLEASPEAPCTLPDGRRITSLALGWVFWIACLQQYLVEFSPRLAGLLVE
ncbi:MAG: hypothetical protein ACK2UW_01390 [Anaerolineales bacterium]